MEAVENIVATQPANRGKLLKILGVGFGIAVGIGGTIGVGILRNPGGVAEQLGSFWLIMLAWALGGVYCLLGANYLAKLATVVLKAAAVNRGGTPVFALITTALCAVLFSSVGTFEMLLAIGQFFALVIVILIVVAFFKLRRVEPDTPRPFRAWFYPFAPALMFVFAVLLFFGYIYGNPFPSLYALAALAASYPIFVL